MTGNDFLDKLEMLDADLIEDADKPSTIYQWRNALKYCAAILCVVLLGGLILAAVIGEETQGGNAPSDIVATGTEKKTEDYENANYLTFDINPSFQLTVLDDVVVGYVALNDDGEDILKNVEVIGKDVEEALPLIIGELVAQGYLAKKDYAPVMLISSRGNENAWQLLEEAIVIAQDALVNNEVETFIVAQQIGDTSEVEILAEQYGVSVGKMQYVLNLLREESELSAEEASDYTVIELFGMDIEKRLIEPPYKVGDYDEYGEKVLFVGTVESYVGYIPWDKLSEEYTKQLSEMYTPEALEILAMQRVWTTMPGVVGMAVDEALDVLYSRNIAPMICYEDNPYARFAGYQDGMVFKQDIPQGKRWHSDASVGIWVLVSEKDEEQVSPAVDWGLVVSIKHVTKTGATIVYEQNGSDPQGVLTRGKWYVIERWNGSNWEELPLISEEIVWNIDGYAINQNTTVEIEESWEETYGALTAGKYRIGKPAANDYWDYDYETKIFYMEFEITD